MNNTKIYTRAFRNLISLHCQNNNKKFTVRNFVLQLLIYLKQEIGFNLTVKLSNKLFKKSNRKGVCLLFALSKGN